jgi:hypothetical protein
MLTSDEDREIGVLAADGWSMSAVACHHGHNPKTIRAHPHVDRAARQGRCVRSDGFEPFVNYVRDRLAAHPDLTARALHQELVLRGFSLSYPTLTARLRVLGLRPPKPDDIVGSNETATEGAVALRDATRSQAPHPGDLFVVAPMAHPNSPPLRREC